MHSHVRNTCDNMSNETQPQYSVLLHISADRVVLLPWIKSLRACPLLVIVAQFQYRELHSTSPTPPGLSIKHVSCPFWSQDIPCSTSLVPKVLVSHRELVSIIGLEISEWEVLRKCQLILARAGQHPLRVRPPSPCPFLVSPPLICTCFTFILICPCCLRCEHLNNKEYVFSSFGSFQWIINMPWCLVTDCLTTGS